MLQQESQGARQPFIFGEGQQANTVEDLVRLCERLPENAIYYLLRGDFEKWLDYIGESRAALCAKELRQANAPDKERLRRFIHSCAFNGEASSINGTNTYETAKTFEGPMKIITTGDDAGWCRCEYCGCLLLPEESKYILHIATCASNPQRTGTDADLTLNDRDCANRATDLAAPAVSSPAPLFQIQPPIGASEFDVARAYFLAKASKAAYLPKDSDYLKSLRVNNLRFFSTDLVLGFVGSTDDSVIIVFKGTDIKNLRQTLTDMDSNVDCLLRSCDLGNVHSGFSKGVSSIWDVLIAALREEVFSGKPIFLAGHSRGGALAILSASLLFTQGFPVAGVYTFGSPRTGDHNFVSRFNLNLKHYRIEQGSDIVPLLPLSPASQEFVTGIVELEPFGISSGTVYWHTGNLIYIDEDTIKVRRNETDEDQAFNGLNKARALIGRRSPWKDHNIDNYIKSLEFHDANKKRLATTSNSAHAIKQKLSRDPRRFKGHKSGVTSISFSPDGRYVLTGDKKCTVKLWEVATGKEMQCYTHESSFFGCGAQVACSPDGKYAAVAGDDYLIRLYDLISGKQVNSLSGHSWSLTFDGKGIHSVEFLPDGRRLLSSGVDHTIRLWDIKAGKQLEKWRQAFISTVKLSRSGRYFLAMGGAATSEESLLGGYSAFLRKVDGSFILLTGHSYKVEGLCADFSPDDRLVIIGDRQSNLRLFETDFPGKEIYCMESHQSGVTGVAFTPDGKFAISAGGDNTICCWDIEAGSTVSKRSFGSFLDRLDQPSVVAMSPVGTHVLVGNTGGNLYLWEL
jgi:WD40 repeat protein